MSSAMGWGDLSLTLAAPHTDMQAVPQARRHEVLLCTQDRGRRQAGRGCGHPADPSGTMLRAAGSGHPPPPRGEERRAFGHLVLSSARLALLPIARSRVSEAVWRDVAKCLPSANSLTCWPTCCLLQRWKASFSSACLSSSA